MNITISVQDAQRLRADLAMCKKTLEQVRLPELQEAINRCRFAIAFLDTMLPTPEPPRTPQSNTSFPQTRGELLRWGYKRALSSDGSGRVGDPKRCTCGALIEWWITKNKRSMPFNEMGEDDSAPAVAHWATCPDAERFRKRAK